jgi:16S rRNA (cytosine1407-C5)-methyltransferase
MSSGKNKRRNQKPVPNTTSQQNVEILLKKLLPLLPPEEHQLLLKELQKPLRPALRTNPLKQRTNDGLAGKLSQRYGWELSPISYCDCGFWQEHESEFSLGQTWEHRLGRYYVQDASSMLPVELFDFSMVEEPLVLDMAASPGGKTTHLISKTMDKGLIIANDASRDRIQALRIVLQNWGGVRHAITQFQGERFGQWFPNTFDAILLDAPCSMQNLRPTEARPMRPISDREENTLAKRQRKLLESALFSAKPGGQIVYATCTLSPEEDEMVLDWLISKYPRSIQVDDLASSLNIHAPGITEYNERTFSSNLQKAFRLWPHRLSSSGFFCVRLTKLDEIQGKIRSMPTFSIENTDFRPLEFQKKAKLTDFFKKLSVDLQIQFLQKDYSLWQRKETIYLFPDRYFNEIGFLPLRSLGLPIAQITTNTFLPDHFFLSRLFYETDLPSTIIEEGLARQWQAGMSIPLPSTNAELVLLENSNNEFLGVGKRSGNQLKNLLPRRMIL